MQVGGGISANGFFFATDRPNAQRVPFSYVLSGNVNVLLLNTIAVPLSFSISDRSRDFRQSINQFGISPQYKWMKFHLGYRNISFSKYTLAGHTFLGVGFEGERSIFRFGAIYGQFLRPIQLDTANIQNTLPVYRRKGYAVKFGVGKPQNFVDLVFFKGKDLINSIDSLPPSVAVSPAENSVVGLITHQTILKIISLDAEYALSAYTLDMRQPEIDVPQFPLINNLKALYRPRTSSQLLTAADVRLGLRLKWGQLAVQYTRVEPDYKSMGSFFFNTDVENLTLSPSWSMLKNRLRMSASYGVQRNNLMFTKANNTNRRIGALNVAYTPNNWYNVTATYNNFEFNQAAVSERIGDTLKLVQVSQNGALNNNFNFGTGPVRHNLNLGLTYQVFNDQNNLTPSSNGTQSWNAMVNYRYIDTPSNIGLNGGLNVNTFSREGANTVRYGVNVGVNKSLSNKKANLNANGSFFRNYTNNKPDSNTLTFRLGGNYRVDKHHSLVLHANYINRMASVDGGRSFNEVLTNLGYNYSF